MPVSPFERDADPRAAPDSRHESRYEAAAAPEVRVPALEDPDKPGAEEALEEPGYGHGV